MADPGRSAGRIPALTPHVMPSVAWSVMGAPHTPAPQVLSKLLPTVINMLSTPHAKSRAKVMRRQWGPLLIDAMGSHQRRSSARQSARPAQRCTCHHAPTIQRAHREPHMHPTPRADPGDSVARQQAGQSSQGAAPAPLAPSGPRHWHARHRARPAGTHSRRRCQRRGHRRGGGAGSQPHGAKFRAGVFGDGIRAGLLGGAGGCGECSA